MATVAEAIVFEITMQAGTAAQVIDQVAEDARRTATEAGGQLNVRTEAAGAEREIAESTTTQAQNHQSILERIHSANRGLGQMSHLMRDVQLVMLGVAAAVELSGLAQASMNGTIDEAQAKAAKLKSTIEEIPIVGKLASMAGAAINDFFTGDVTALKRSTAEFKLMEQITDVMYKNTLKMVDNSVQFELNMRQSARSTASAGQEGPTKAKTDAHTAYINEIDKLNTEQRQKDADSDRAAADAKKAIKASQEFKDLESTAPASYEVVKAQKIVDELKATAAKGVGRTSIPEDTQNWALKTLERDKAYKDSIDKVNNLTKQADDEKAQRAVETSRKTAEIARKYGVDAAEAQAKVDKDLAERKLKDEGDLAQAKLRSIQDSRAAERQALVDQASQAERAAADRDKAYSGVGGGGEEARVKEINKVRLEGFDRETRLQQQAATDSARVAMMRAKGQDEAAFKEEARLRHEKALRDAGSDTTLKAAANEAYYAELTQHARDKGITDQAASDAAHIAILKAGGETEEALAEERKSRMNAEIKQAGDNEERIKDIKARSAAEEDQHAADRAERMASLRTQAKTASMRAEGEDQAATLVELKQSLRDELYGAGDDVERRLIQEKAAAQLVETQSRGQWIDVQSQSRAMPDSQQGDGVQEQIRDILASLPTDLASAISSKLGLGE
jgi:hypothetical protein